MRRALAFLTLLVLALGVAMGGCGNGEGEASGGQSASAEADPSSGDGRFGTITLPEGKSKPKIKPPEKPPPKKVLIRDLRIGKGRVAREGDELTLYYWGVDYKTGRPIYYRWPPEPPLVQKLGGAHWEKALLGMKAGGQREVIVPSRLLFNDGTIDYFFEARHID